LYLVFAFLLFDDEFFDFVRAYQFLAVKDSYSVFIADDYDVKGQIVIKLFNPGHGDCYKDILFEVETLQAFRVVFYQNTFAMSLYKT
jgi:hypothetical protein